MVKTRGVLTFYYIAQQSIYTKFFVESTENIMQNTYTYILKILESIQPFDFSFFDR